ncbi:unnamed protein product, partial [Rhizoctonia solani]
PVPTVWKKISRLDIVLQLIKGMEGKAHRYKDPQQVHHHLTRLQWYFRRTGSQLLQSPPWVQELEIFTGHNIEIQNIGPFLTLLGGGPLPPNLWQLTTHTGTDIGSRDMSKFLNMFINLSLLELRTIIHKKGLPSHVHPSTVPALLKWIQETCPRILILEF